MYFYPASITKCSQPEINCTKTLISFKKKPLKLNRNTYQYQHGQQLYPHLANPISYKLMVEAEHSHCQMLQLTKVNKAQKISESKTKEQNNREEKKKKHLMQSEATK